MDNDIQKKKRGGEQPFGAQSSAVTLRVPVSPAAPLPIFLMSAQATGRGSAIKSKKKGRPNERPALES